MSLQRLTFSVTFNSTTHSKAAAQALVIPSLTLHQYLLWWRRRLDPQLNGVRSVFINSSIALTDAVQPLRRLVHEPVHGWPSHSPEVAVDYLPGDRVLNLICGH